MTVFTFSDLAFMGAALAGPQTSFLLDTYTGAAAAYSLRQIKTGVTSVVRVRRSSDNAEADFTATEVSNGSLAAWVGGGNNGFVRTWYDQSGNGRNAEQATTAKQPLIVSSGSLNTTNGMAAINFSDARNDSLVTAGSISGSQPFTAFSVARVTGTALNRYMWNVGATQLASFSNFAGIALIFAGSFFSSGINVLNQQVLRYSLFNSSSSEIAVNAGSVVTGNAGTQVFSGVIRIGAKTQTNTVDRFQGDIQEVLLYGSDQSGAKTAIGSDINTYYSIY